MHKIKKYSFDNNDDALKTLCEIVKAGDTVALVEAMKTFNPIKSDIDGVVKEILVADGVAVEFDTPIIVIEQVSNATD